MANRTWRAQLTVVWLLGFALIFFIFGLSRGTYQHTHGILSPVFSPLHESMSILGTLGPFQIIQALLTTAAWAAPFASIALALRGRRLLRAETDESLRDKLQAGTTAAYIIIAAYVTPVGWVLLYGLTRWTIGDLLGEGPLGEPFWVSHY